MKKRFLSFVLAGILVFTLVIGVLPIRAGAVLPVGFVESAFASYAMSSGYTFFSEEMDDPLFLGLFRELYDDFVTVKSALGQTIRRWDEYDNRDVYLDRSGNIVVSYGVAQDWAGAMEWIQSHYDIEDGGPAVDVVLSGSSERSIMGDGYNLISFNLSSFLQVNNNDVFYSPEFIHRSTRNSSTIYPGSFQPGFTAYYTIYNGGFYAVNPTSSVLPVGSLTYFPNNPVATQYSYSNSTISSYSVTRLENYPGNNLTWNEKLPISSVNPASLDLYALNSPSGGVLSSLAASVAISVTDIAQGMTEDDAVVIGVGAVPGITEGEIAEFIADGIRADTLDPTATVTATDVIDTPVQPYPDIDGLGLPSLGAALTSRFPFCIPWDFVDTVQLLAADPVAPDFSFDLLPQRIRDYCHITASTEVRFNMGDPKFSKVGVFCRWGSLVSFCFGLAVLTKRMIWTA